VVWRGRPRPRMRPARMQRPSDSEIQKLGVVHSSQTRNTGLIKLLALAGGGARPTHPTMSGAPLAKYRYRRRLPHLQRADADLFVTFCTARFSLPGTARDLVLEHCLREGGIQPLAGAGPIRLRSGRARAPQATPRIHIYAAVIMPDHVHLLLMPLRDLDGWPFPLVDSLQCLKSTTADRINKLLHRDGPVWEEESFDHVRRSDERLKEKCKYLRQNPVRRGLVRQPEDYRWLWVDQALRS